MLTTYWTHHACCVSRWRPCCHKSIDAPQFPCFKHPGYITSSIRWYSFQAFHIFKLAEFFNSRLTSVNLWQFYVPRFHGWIGSLNQEFTTRMNHPCGAPLPLALAPRLFNPWLWNHPWQGSDHLLLGHYTQSSQVDHIKTDDMLADLLDN